MDQSSSLLKILEFTELYWYLEFYHVNYLSVEWIYFFLKVSESKTDRQANSQTDRHWAPHAILGSDINVFLRPGFLVRVKHLYMVLFV